MQHLVDVAIPGMAGERSGLHVTIDRRMVGNQSVPLDIVIRNQVDKGGFVRVPPIGLVQPPHGLRVAVGGTGLQIRFIAQVPAVDGGIVGLRGHGGGQFKDGA